MKVVLEKFVSDQQNVKIANIFSCQFSIIWYFKNLPVQKFQLNGSCIVNLYNVDSIEANTTQCEAIY